MKRIFIDSDYIQDDEVRTSKRQLRRILETSGINTEGDIFDDVVGHAWHEPYQAWDAVKSADEIYANSSLVPLCGYGSYTGSVVVFDVMMEKAIAEDIKGKSVFFMRHYEDIEWDGIDLKILPKAFKHNKLFTLEYKDGSDFEEEFKEVDIKKLIKEHK